MAIPFITIDEENDGRFLINPEAVELLRGIEGRVAVVAVAGLYRTGKSLLLNLLSSGGGPPPPRAAVAGSVGGAAASSGGAGFAVGGTVRACTKGIHLYSRPPAPAAPGQQPAPHVLFLDTEGLGSTVRSETYDARLFALALLLSSSFVYNSVGTIDGNAVSKLSLVVALTRHIHVRAQPGGGAGREDSGTEFAQFFPSFMWVVRDFAVKLEKDGRKISSREYLEDALRPEEGLSEAVEAKNAVRMLLRSFFPERDCVTMVRPVADEKALMALGSGAAEDLEAQLRPEFRQQVEALRKKVVGAARPKTLYGKPLSGAMLASLAAAYVQALNSNATPTIATAWDRVVDSQCADALEAAAATYAARMAELVAAASQRADAAVTAAAAKAGTRASANACSSASALLVVEDEELHAAHADASQAAARLFQLKAVQDGDRTPGYEQQLRERIAAEHARVRRANEVASAQQCGAVLQRLHAAAATRLSLGDGDSDEAAAGEDTAGADGEADADAEFEEDGDDDGAGEKGDTGGKGALAAARRRDAALAASSRARRAAESVITPSALAAAYRASCAALREAYMREARGPARGCVLADYALGGGLPTTALADAAAHADATTRRLEALLEARAAACERALAKSRAQARGARQLLAQEASSSGAALAEAARVAAAEREQLSFRVQAREAELARLSDKFDRLVGAFEAASVRADAAETAHASDLAGARARVDELLSARVGLLLSEGTAAQRLADAERRRAELEQLHGEQRLRAEQGERSVAVMVERVKAAENECVRLREQTELLYEANRVAKEVAGHRNDEKEEAEYQLGVAKGKVAEGEGLRAQLAADLVSVEALASRMKAVLVKDKALKKLGLDRQEQRRFDSLPDASAT